MLTSQILFYGGIAAAAVAVIGAIIFTLLMRLSAARLSEKLREEYGESPEKNNKKYN